SFDEQIADGGVFCAVGSGKASMAVGCGECFDGLARGEEIFQNAFFDNVNRLGSDAFVVKGIIAGERVAVPCGLSGIVGDVDPIGKNAGADFRFELAGEEIYSASVGKRFARNSEVIADQLGEELGGGLGLEQRWSGK